MRVVLVARCSGSARMPDAGDLTRGVELSRVVGVSCAALTAAVALLARY